MTAWKCIVQVELESPDPIVVEKVFRVQTRRFNKEMEQGPTRARVTKVTARVVVPGQVGQAVAS